MSCLKYSIFDVRSLVAVRQKLGSTTVFVTLSPNASTKVECILKDKYGKCRTVKRPYGMLKQDIQYQYCLKCFQEDYGEWLSDEVILTGVAELNERGNVHLHILIDDPNIVNDTQLQIFRRDILNGWRTQQNISKGKAGRPKDWMNNIVWLTKPAKDIMDYMTKQQDTMLPRFPAFYKGGKAPEFITAKV